MGVEKADYIKAALKQPSLFYQSPETIYRNFLAVQAAHRAGFIQSEDLKVEALNNPPSLTYSPLNTALREAQAMVLKCEPVALSTFFSGRNKNKATVEKHLHQGLSALFDRAVDHAEEAPDLAARIQNLARHLHEQKITANLPEFAAH